MSHLQALDELEEKRKAETKELEALRIRVKELEVQLPTTTRPVFTGWIVCKNGRPVLHTLLSTQIAARLIMEKLACDNVARCRYSNAAIETQILRQGFSIHQCTICLF